MICLAIYQPRPYQAECLAALAEARQNGIQKGLVVMASGLGKTLTAIFDFQQFLQDHPGAHVLCLCHHEEILLQSKAKFQQFYGEEFSYGMFTGNDKTPHRVDFLFATFQTMKDRREEFPKDAFDYIIIDEAHHTPAVTYRPTVDYFEPQFLIGLTATKDRMDGQDLLDIYEQILYQMDIYDGWEQGWLARVDYRIMLDDLNEEEFQKYVGPQAANEKVSLSQLNKTIFAPRRDEEIVASICEQTADLDKSSIFVFCSSIEHANVMAGHFGGEAAVIHSGQNVHLNEAILDRFRSGDLRIIISVDMLNEGIDVPEANVIVFLRNTESLRIFFQQLGRGLRISGENRIVRVLDYVANLERIAMILEMEETAQKRIPAHSTSYPPVGKPDPIVVNIPATKFKVQRVDIERLIEQSTQPRWTEEVLIARLRQRAKELGRTPYCSDMGGDFPPCWEIYRRVFGSWNAALRAAELKVNIRRNEYTVEQLIEDIRMLYRELGRVPTRRDVAADKRCASPKVYVNYFGSWNNALIAANLAVNLRRQITDEELLGYLRSIITELGHPPTLREFNQMQPKYSWSAYLHHFGTWKRAVELATGGAHRACCVHSAESELIEDLKQLTIRLGRLPQAIEVVREKTMASPSTYKRFFGPKWKDVLKNTGVLELAESLLAHKETEPLLTPEQIKLMRAFVHQNHRRLRTKDLLLLDPKFSKHTIRKKGGIGAINTFIGADQILAELAMENS